MKRSPLAIVGSLVLLAAASLLGAVSLEDSDSAAVKLERVTDGELGPGETVDLTDSELNSFLHYEYAREMPDGVRGLRVRFQPDIGVVNAFVDFQKLASNSSGGPGRFLLWMLRGEREVVARTRYVSANGEARVDIESFKVNGREMKGPLLEWLVNTYVAPNMDGFELGEPVELGHNLEQVRLERGKAVFVGAERSNEIAAQ